MTDCTPEEILADREAHGLPLLAGAPSTFTAKDFAIAGEDHRNDRLLVTILQWARLVNHGVNVVAHRGGEEPNPELTREEWLEVRAAIDLCVKVE